MYKNVSALAVTRPAKTHTSSYSSTASLTILLLLLLLHGVHLQNGYESYDWDWQSTLQFARNKVLSYTMLLNTSADQDKTLKLTVMKLLVSSLSLSLSLFIA